ncbi:hypothetical protein [Paraburkholderia dinghuensis]|nr:hypothetical protein [Paraburkholderia dinghuensis]
MVSRPQVIARRHLYIRRRQRISFMFTLSLLELAEGGWCPGKCLFAALF